MLASCPVKFNCSVCRARHHTLLHKNKFCTVVGKLGTNKDMTPVPIKNQAVPEGVANVNVVKIKGSPIIFLSTVMVKVVDRWNKLQSVRFLIDSGSVTNLLTQDCCKRLGLGYVNRTSNVVGLEGLLRSIKGRTSLTLYSNADNIIKYTIEVFVMYEITNTLPDKFAETSHLPHLQYIPLADPSLFNTPGAID